MKYPLTPEEIWLRNCSQAQVHSKETLPWDKLFEYEEHLNNDRISDARNILLDNPNISDEEKELLRSMYKYN